MNQLHFEKLNSIKLVEEWNQEKSKLSRQISEVSYLIIYEKDKNKIVQEKAELNLNKKILKDSENESKISIENERQALRTGFYK